MTNRKDPSLKTNANILASSEPDKCYYRNGSCALNYIRVITKLPNSEQFYNGKVKTHKYINRQNQSTTGKL
jgi:hypothetical protein